MRCGKVSLQTQDVPHPVLDNDHLWNCDDPGHHGAQPLWVQKVQVREVALDVIEMKQGPSLVEKLYGLFHLCPVHFLGEARPTHDLLQPLCCYDPEAVLGFDESTILLLNNITKFLVSKISMTMLLGSHPCVI